jgi:predicted O-methyltransferase YrrM
MAMMAFLIHSKSIHSAQPPFLYNFILNIFNKKNKHPELANCIKEKKNLFLDSSPITITDYGTGNKQGLKYDTMVSQQAKRSLKSNREIKYLFQFVAHYQPSFIIELGTSFGISTLAMASASPNSEIISFEGCPQTATKAINLFQKNEIHNTSFVIGNIDEVLENSIPKGKTFDLAIVDANHTYEHTLKYFFMLKNMRNSKSVIIFDDIHWSKDINNAWNEIKADEDVQLTVETWNFGFVFFNPDLSKQDFILRKF